MLLHPPFIIGPRLLPCLKIGNAFLYVEFAAYETAYDSPDGRERYTWRIDLADGQEFSSTDLSSGVQGASLQEMFVCLLSFLGAAAESYDYGHRTGHKGENADLFPLPVVEWASANDNEISMLRLEIEESGAELIQDE